MARPLRIEYEGALYHVTSRGNERKDIYYTKRDNDVFREIMESAYKRFKIIIHAYCLLTNHYHFLIETPKANLSKCMQYINSSYTTYFNRKRKRAGHLFQGRYAGILVEEEAYLLKLSRYIHLNPIRANMAKLPEEFEWSSYKYYVKNGARKPIFLDTKRTLGYFHDDVSRYKGFVEEGLVKTIKNPILEAFANIILGREEFVDRIKREYIDKDKKQRDLPALRKIRAERIDPERIIKMIEKHNGIIASEKRNKLFAYFLRSYTDHSLEEISNRYMPDKSPSALSNMMYRFRRQMETDIDLRKLVDGIIEEMCCGEV